MPLTLNKNRVLSKTVVTAALKVANQGLAFALYVLLARMLDAENFGLYMLAFAWLQILGLFGRLGMDMAATRYLPGFIADGDFPQIKRFLLFAFALSGGAGIVLLAGALVLGAVLGIGSPAFTVMIFALPFFSLLGLSEASLRAFGRPVRGLVSDAFIRPAIQIVLVCLLFFVTWESFAASHAALVLVASYVIVFGVSLVWLSWAMEKTRTEKTGQIALPRAGAPFEWASYGFFMVLMAGGTMLIKQTDIVMLGALMDATAAGVYAVATKVSMLATFGLTACSLVIGPAIASLYHQGKKEELQRLLRQGAKIILLLSVILVAGIWLFAPFLLSLLFGTLYVEQSSLPLTILLAAQAINALSGPVGYLMALTGHQKRASLILLSVAATNILLNYLLIGVYGTVGAALATALATILWNVLMLVYVSGKLKLNPTAFGRGARETS